MECEDAELTGGRDVFHVSVGSTCIRFVRAWCGGLDVCQLGRL